MRGVEGRLPAAPGSTPRTRRCDWLVVLSRSPMRTVLLFLEWWAAESLNRSGPSTHGDIAWSADGAEQNHFSLSEPQQPLSYVDTSSTRLCFGMSGRYTRRHKTTFVRHANPGALIVVGAQLVGGFSWRSFGSQPSSSRRVRPSRCRERRRGGARASLHATDATASCCAMQHDDWARIT